MATIREQLDRRVQVLRDASAESVHQATLLHSGYSKGLMDARKEAKDLLQGTMPLEDYRVLEEKLKACARLAAEMDPIEPCPEAWTQLWQLLEPYGLPGSGEE